MQTVDELFDRIEARAKAKESPSFNVGDRVRMNPQRGQQMRRFKSHTGVVILCGVNDDGFGNMVPQVYVKRDGVHSKEWWHVSWWLPIPRDELTRDETCQQLVCAYHRGDTDAALLLADRIFELCGGSRTQTLTTGDL